MSTEVGVFARQFTQINRVITIGVASGRIMSVDFQSTVPSDADDDHTLLAVSMRILTVTQITFQTLILHLLSRQTNDACLKRREIFHMVKQ
ncbi:MAG: hypothetical protein J07HQW2_02956 [Haloquadratum walsbyi J07HQW2]|uniref:Uncharacterized protein n=1 Tax=Haloquadratum walsbyi J07HQW2 TaxID=1238425 RepID=U1PRT7_9EURY|nr:MAG: hypothetical protein J07HQW2_02956 [Haloquadratum walsbyi J07HQW2]